MYDHQYTCIFNIVFIKRNAKGKYNIIKSFFKYFLSTSSAIEIEVWHSQQRINTSHFAYLRMNICTTNLTEIDRTKCTCISTHVTEQGLYVVF